MGLESSSRRRTGDSPSIDFTSMFLKEKAEGEEVKCASKVTGESEQVQTRKTRCAGGDSRKKWEQREEDTECKKRSKRNG